MVTNLINLAPEYPGCRTSGFFQKSAWGKRSTVEFRYGLDKLR